MDKRKEISRKVGHSKFSSLESTPWLSLSTWVHTHTHTHTLLYPELPLLSEYGLSWLKLFLPCMVLMWCSYLSSQLAMWVLNMCTSDVNWRRQNKMDIGKHHPLVNWMFQHMLFRPMSLCWHVAMDVDWTKQISWCVHVCVSFHQSNPFPGYTEDQERCGWVLNDGKILRL